jgi:hypothetical protein
MLVDFPPMITWPKPVQKPHPPVIVGGAFAWPRASDPRSLSATVAGAPEDPDLPKRYRDLGIARVSFPLPPAHRDEVMPALDGLADPTR